jgi:tetratricopeptide (TPR) repeat protein
MGRRGYLSPNSAYPTAKDHAMKAIALDEGLAEPHATLGAILAEHEWRWEEAEMEFMRAVALNPSYATGHNWYALHLGHVGRIDEGIEEIERARQLDPLSPAIHCGAAEEYLFAGAYDKALDAARKALEIDPENAAGYGNLASAYVEKGMFPQAIAAYKRELELVEGGGRDMVTGELGFAYAISGKKRAALRILKKLTLDYEAKKQEASAFAVGIVYIGLAERAKALDWIERSLTSHISNLAHLRSDPIFRSMQGEPRFRAIMQKIGLA